jgi:L-Ala-D/L-Glu epimerase
MPVTKPPAPLTLQLDIEKWPLKAPFRITGHTFVELQVVVAAIGCRGHVGRGEAAGVYYRGETAASMATQIEAVRAKIEAGIDRESLQLLLPPGGARNAVDCALWDLEARLSGMPAWKIAGLNAPVPLITTFTLGAEDPTQMARTAASYADAQAIKLKLTGTPDDAERVRAVRRARPDVWMAVDANQGFTPASLAELMPVLVDARVGLIEQPFPIGREADLDGLRSPIPLAADESVQGLNDIEALVGRFNVVNIKLDKSGGLTEALTLADAAERAGLAIMVGCMVSTSLSMAPAMLVAQRARVVDLDGPLLLAKDREGGLRYEGSDVYPASPKLWG